MTDDEAMRERYFHPDLKAIRQRAVRHLLADMDALLLPAGYVRKGNVWSRITSFAKTLVELQRSAGGYCCYVNVVRFQRFHKWEWIPQGDVFSGWRLGDFLRRSEGHIDQLFYVDLEKDQALRQRVLNLLSDRVLPFLKRAQLPWGYLFFPPRIADQRAGR